MARIKEFKDYYKILNIPESASQEEIKKSFRKLALESHPDHNPDDPNSEAKFKAIAEAYGVLSDPQKKQEYDRFRADHLAGRSNASSRFHYSQEDIFSSMFQGKNARDIFEELNREFSRSGVRSGNNFFKNIFFGGAVGGIGSILRMIPGPIGRIGMGIRLAQMLGTSLYALHRMKKAKDAANPDKQEKIDNPIVSNIKNVFGISKAEKKLDMDFAISIPPVEALNGTRKKISYQVDGMTEQLMVRIPPGFPSGGKLRIRNKGRSENEKRGDLILSINVDPKVTPAN